MINYIKQRELGEEELIFTSELKYSFDGINSIMTELSYTDDKLMINGIYIPNIAKLSSLMGDVFTFFNAQGIKLFDTIGFEEKTLKSIEEDRVDGINNVLLSVEYIVSSTDKLDVTLGFGIGNVSLLSGKIIEQTSSFNELAEMGISDMAKIARKTSRQALPLNLSTSIFLELDTDFYSLLTGYELDTGSYILETTGVVYSTELSLARALNISEMYSTVINTANAETVFFSGADGDIILGIIYNTITQDLNGDYSYSIELYVKNGSRDKYFIQDNGIGNSGIKVFEEEETQGLDTSEHGGMEAYPDFASIKRLRATMGRSLPVFGVERKLNDNVTVYAQTGNGGIRVSEELDTQSVGPIGIEAYPEFRTIMERSLPEIGIKFTL